MGLLKIVICGLSITSSWGNGHATTYRSLVRGLVRRGHDVLFLEHDKPWYAGNRDMPQPPFGRTRLYASVEELFDTYHQEIASADLVIVGSYVPQGIEVGRWVQATANGMTAFYDIDTPVTLAKLQRCECDYLAPAMIRKYDLYLSFTGGPTLRHLQRKYGSPCARPLHCCVDPDIHFPRVDEACWDLGYLGTYSDDRQPGLEGLMLSAARTWPRGRFVVAGPQYPDRIEWPQNVRRIEHLPPAEHRAFYCSQRFTLNITRSDMVRAGYSPSVRLFEAAACGVPIISDCWPGLETFFMPGREILISWSVQDTLRFLREMPEGRRTRMAAAARERVLAEHTADQRAAQLETYAMRLRQRVPKAA